MRFDYTYGIEIECYLPAGTTQQQACDALAQRQITCTVAGYTHRVHENWKVVTDGSLGDYARGVEFVSPILRGPEGFNQVKAVCAALDDFGCTVSKACGVHVHVGVRDFADLRFFKELAKTYAYFEPVFDSLVPASRRKSNSGFAKSMTSVSFDRVDAARSLEDLITLYAPGTAHSADGAHRRRYYKVNMQSFAGSRYDPRPSGQTVEFRQHSGTLSGDKICRWAHLLLGLVDAVKNGKTVQTRTQAAGGSINRARIGSKAWQVGQLMLRPEGVTRSEAMAATGWPAISLPQQANACGLGFTTQRTGNTVRYFAQAAEAVTATAVTLDGFCDYFDCNDDDRAYFRQRVANLSGSAQWAA